MIRNVVVGRLRPDADRSRLEEFLTAMRGLRVDGAQLSLTAGADLGLRDGTWDFAVVVDLADEDAYRRYDEDPEHNRIRAELIAPIAEQVVRVQYALPR